MAVKFENLTREQQDWLIAKYERRPVFLAPRELEEMMTSLGLAEEKLGGTGISSAGRKLAEGFILANRRRREAAAR